MANSSAFKGDIDSGGGINSVDNILKTDFSKLDLELKMRIKKLGRPTPNINLTKTAGKRTEGRTFTRRFTIGIYDRNDWICGCNVRNSLFCFPCLLYFNSNMDKGWGRSGPGVTDLNHLAAKIKNHERSKSHLHASMELALLGNANNAQKINSENRLAIAKHNEVVRKNRHIIARVISCVKFCGLFELTFGGHDGADKSLNRRILFKELMDFSTKLDSSLQDHLSTSTVYFRGTSEIIQNEILDCILNVCKTEILKEVSNANFLSILCDETTDVSNHCQMVLILRYVHGYKVCERFWSFLQVTDRTANGLVQHIQREVNHIISNPDKLTLIAQSYDGASATNELGGGVQAKMRKKYPFAYFVHCYAHHLNLIMQKAAEQNPQVRMFFSDLSGIPAFFSNFTNQCGILEEIVKNRIPQVALTQWNFNSSLLNTIYENRESLIRCFQEICERMENTITVREANAARRTLEDPNFMFWLTFFKKVFPHVDMLYNQLQARQIDSIQLKKAVFNFEAALLQIQEETVVIKEEWLSDTDDGTKRKRTEQTDMKSVYAKEICDVIITQIKDRLSYKGHLEADFLLKNQLFNTFDNCFPCEIFDRVTAAYPMLAKERLRTELEVMYSRCEFSRINGATNILAFILKNNLESTFPEVVKLLKIILTTPMNTTDAERCFSTLKRVKILLRNSMSNDKPNALAMMSINRDFVREISNFDEKVLEKFESLEHRRLDFTYKD